MRLGLFAGVIAASFLVLAGIGAAAQTPDYRDVNLGDRRAGEVFPVTLAVQNVSCPQPVDFRFSSKSNWLRLPADPVVRQVAQGQTKTLQITVDLSGAPPGQKVGFIDIDCENCGVLIFRNCKIDRQALRFNVNVLGDAQPGGQPQQGPQPGGQSGAIANAPPQQIDYDDQRIPKPLRRKAKAAHDDWEAKLKKKKPCDEELAKLRAAAAAAEAEAGRANRAAETAEQDARNARAQEEAAREELKRANKEAVDAQAAVDAAEKALKAANSNGTTAERAEARANLEKAKAAKEAADKRVADAVKAVRLPIHSPKDLAAMDKEAERKARAAKEAKARAASAAAAVAKKEEECAKIQREIDKAAADAEAAAKEAKAAIPAVRPPSAEDIDKARKAANDCIRELGELIDAQAKAMQALASLGALKKDPVTGDDPNTYDSDLSDWAEGVDAANDIFESIPPEVKYAGPVGEAIDTYAGAASSVLGAIRTAIGVWSGVKYTGKLNLAPKAGVTKSPEKTKQYLKDQGLAGSNKEADAILKQMESYSETNSTKGMQQQLADKKAKCDALVSAAEGRK